MEETLDQTIIKELLQAIDEHLKLHSCAPLCARCVGLREKAAHIVYSRYHQKG